MELQTKIKGYDMVYEQYIAWIDANKPDGMPMADFKDFLGFVGATMVQHITNTKGLTIHEQIDVLFDDSEASN